MATTLPREAAAWVVAVADLGAVEDRASGLGHEPCGLVAVVHAVVVDAGRCGNWPYGQGGR